MATFRRFPKPSERGDFASQDIATEPKKSKVLMWKPQHGKRRVGRPAKTYTDLLEEDTGLKGGELEAVMADRAVWRNVIRSRRDLRCRLSP